MGKFGDTGFFNLVIRSVAEIVGEK